ncbi:acetyl-CoA carboxylase biotin carboxyl carrier protein [Protofrankia symbiont of Coriaria ruscifolia]|uniref:acetyl-CoA carboxylase biotin carboxyl carrier protein n=1 Tax=Protofrankia symbiont of Coriaria ruscifolia TaxID=1306542 RepID=UPI0010417591|nr:biotin/lipoyl-containing protein [Protofrankia symbiont of Coriaria ruscifolia]
MSPVQLNGVSPVRATVPSAGELDEIMTVLRQQLLTLSTQTSRVPSRVRVAAGDVFIEIAWSETTPSASAELFAPASVASSVPVSASAPVRRQEPARTEAAQPPAAPAADVHLLCAATVGVFYRASEPGAKPFVVEGDLITRGQQVAIIEAMKLMIPVEADASGRVVEVLVADGTPVEHGQPLLGVAAVDADRPGSGR